MQGNEMSFRSAAIAGFAAIALLISACGPAEQTDAPAAASEEPIDMAAHANALAQNSIIIDTHIDVPYRLEEAWEDVSVATDGGDFDYPRAKAGGLNAPFMSIYTPAGLEAEGRSKEVAEGLIDLVDRIVDESPDKFAIALSPDDVESQFAAGLISLPMGMENGSPIEGDIANVQHFFDRGIRYITLAHGLSNHISDSSYDENKQWDGLSEFGVEVVKEMNRIGIIVSDGAFWDVMEVATAPAIASHSSARHFTAGWERNIADDMIVRLAENGGVVMINYGSAFLTQEAQDYGNNKREAMTAYLEENGIEISEDASAAFNAIYDAEHGTYPYATLDETLDHFDHIRDLVGIDHVGIGTDYDGVGDSLPLGLKDVSSYPTLIEGLLGRGYSDEDVKKILGENLLRVWREVEAVASI
jgi:membrane dipeptidase